MDIGLYRYGECAHLAGLCLGVARHPPRGVRRECRAARGYFDVWLPQLAPSAPLMATFRSGDITFAAFSRRYRREMQAPPARHLIEFVAAVALRQPIHLGCSCPDQARCHRSVLRRLIIAVAESLSWRCASAPSPTGVARTFASPPCAMPEIPD